jgi:hypothetical protein
MATAARSQRRVSVIGPDCSGSFALDTRLAAAQCIA